MLAELVVTNLGVIERSELQLGPGMVALTGETGAGKTLVVQALSLVVGGRADPGLVGHRGDEARVDGRFLVGDSEMILSRVVSKNGRSRAYLDGTPVTVSRLAEIGADLIDVHGQHAHQSLLSARAQREALDRFGGIDLGPLRQAEAEVRRLQAERAQLGGDERERAREIDLLRFQIEEIDAADIEDPDEERRLSEREDVLADAAAHREAAAAAYDLLSGDGGAFERAGQARDLLRGRAPFTELVQRLEALLADGVDAAAEIRAVGEDISEDPGQLDDIRQRRQLLRDLRRKYGDQLVEVIEFADERRGRLAELERHDEIAARLDSEIAAAELRWNAAAAAVAAERRAAAPDLAVSVASRFDELSLRGAELVVAVGGEDPGDDVTYLFEANGQPPPRPLAKVASGGELARIMLALRLVLTSGPPTLVFDEVDAGIGGDTARAVAASLARVAETHQVIVVTHLAQVAAVADQHIVVQKADEGTGVRSHALGVGLDDRVSELARMLSGAEDSASARAHAAELLDEAAAHSGADCR